MRTQLKAASRLLELIDMARAGSPDTLKLNKLLYAYQAMLIDNARVCSKLLKLQRRALHANTARENRRQARAIMKRGILLKPLKLVDA